MSGSLYLTWRYLCQHKGTTAILVASVTLITFLPAGLVIRFSRLARHGRRYLLRDNLAIASEQNRQGKIHFSIKESLVVVGRFTYPRRLAIGPFGTIF